jgi:hypothetical protein
MKTRKNKKVLMSVSLALGALLIMSTAFADSINKSAYDQLKDTIKFTAANYVDMIDSSTVVTTVVLKDNDEEILKHTSTIRTQTDADRSETISTTVLLGKDVSNEYSYRDGEGSIYYDAAADTYYIKQFVMDPAKQYVDGIGYMDNPFDQEGAEDIEKIFDALVGNLQNYVVVTVNEDGTKEYSGSLTDAQIPALINAIVSFASKQFFSQRTVDTVAPREYDSKEQVDSIENAFPKLDGDISIKSVRGKMTVNADGLADGVFVTGVITGIDADGATHDLSLDLLIRMEDVNNTVVSRPDLTGKNVVISEDRYVEETKVLSEKFIGAYRNDIIVETPDALEKIGERILVITEIADGRVKGTYTEVYEEGYEDRLDNLSEFTFDAWAIDPYSVTLEFQDKAGNPQTGSLYFDPTSYTVQFWFDGMKDQKNASFARIFD